MFLSLGGSRRRAAQQQGNAQQSSTGVLQSQQQEFSNQPLVTQADPLKALATGKYAGARLNSFGEPGDSFSSPFGGGYCYSSPTEQVSLTTTTTSPNSTLSFHLPNVPSLSSDTAGEEAISRDCTLTRRSQALDLAKKLKTSLGSKFADSLRETIKEVVKKHDIHHNHHNDDNNNNNNNNNNNAWPLEESSNIDGPSWPVENHLVARAEHSKRLSWFSQENLSQSAIAELSWGAGSMRVADTELGPTDRSAKASWTDCPTIPSRRSRHAFPEAAAMGTCSRLDSGNPNHFRNSRVQYKKVMNGEAESGQSSSFLDVSKGLGKDCASLLDFLNGPGSHHTRPSLAAAQDSCLSWHEKASASYYGAPLLQAQAPCTIDVPSIDKGLAAKRSREPDALNSSVELTSKRQLLDVDDAIYDDDHVGVVAQSVDSILAGGFEEYLSNLATSARVPSCPLADLLEDLSEDSIVPIHLPQGTLID